MFYEDIDYAKTRLSNTYVQTNTGSLFFVENVEYNIERGSIHCFGSAYELNGKEFKCYDLQDLDLTPIPLGFINLESEDTAVYATRIPIRKYWRQGLGTGNLHCFTFYSHKIEGFPPPASLVKTFFNKYPTLDQALSKVKKDKITAFHRNWAISEEDVFCRYKHVGTVKKGAISLSKRFSYLQPRLKEVLNEKNL